MLQKKERKRLLRKIKRKKYPYDIPEIYDLYYYLSKHIEKSLLEFKELCTSGVPHDFENNHDGWGETIDTMIFAFHELANDCPNDPMNEIYDKYPLEFTTENTDYGHAINFKENKKREKIMPEARKKQKIYEAKIETGLSLFAKYYRDLWD